MTRPAAILVGWKEFIDFPDWAIGRVKVKIDTGARTTALGVRRFRLAREGGAPTTVEMELALHRRHPDRLVTVRAAVIDVIRVKNTAGNCELRPLVQTRLAMGPVVKAVRLTVTDRSRMLFPVILGRTALHGDFLVDVSRKYLLKAEGATE